MQLLLGVKEFAGALGVGESLAKSIIRRGEVRSVKIGDRRMVPVDEARAFIARLVAEIDSGVAAG